MKRREFLKKVGIAGLTVVAGVIGGRSAAFSALGYDKTEADKQDDGVTREKHGAFVDGKIIKITALAGVIGGITDSSLSGDEKTPMSTIRVTVRLPNATKTVYVPSGYNVLQTISAGFRMYRSSNGLVINGLCGSWKYAINGTYPGYYAGNFRLYAGCTLDLRRM